MRWFTRNQPVSDERLRASIERALRLVCGEPTVHTYSDGTFDLSFGPASTLTSHSSPAKQLSAPSDTTARNEQTKPAGGHTKGEA